MMATVIVLSITACKTYEHTAIFNPEAIYVISRGSGWVELYSKVPGTNVFEYLGKKDVRTLEGYSITYEDWSKEQ